MPNTNPPQPTPHNQPNAEQHDAEQNDPEQANAGQTNEQNDDNPSSLRAFATATGLAFQVVGIIYLMIGAGYFVVASAVDRKGSAANPDIITSGIFDPANRLQAVTTLGILAAIAGGLALATFGLGMQGEKRNSGVAAMISTTILTIIAAATCAGYLYLGPHYLRATIALAFTLINATLFMLAGQSAAVLKAHPAPEDQSIVDDAWIEEYSRIRRQRYD